MRFFPGALLVFTVLLIAQPLVAGLPCTLTTKWSWDGAVQNPTWPDVCGAPVVARVADTNGDGRIDAADTPSVVFVHTSVAVRPNDGLISALDGATGAVLFTTPDVPDRWLLSMNIAVADLDRDGFPQLLGFQWTNRLIAFDHLGSLLWRGARLPPAPMNTEWSAQDTISVADLDQDGSPEIVVGSHVASEAGVFRWLGGQGQGLAIPGFATASRISNAVELSSASIGLELLAGNTLYDAQGNVIWTRNLPFDPDRLEDGWTAVADLDGDGTPEIVYNNTRGLHILGPAGTTLWLDATPATPPNTYRFQPVVADFDGDGLPEVAVARDRQMQMFEWDGAALTMLWSQPLSGPALFASAIAFDYDADGAFELVVSDSDGWRVADGPTGVELAAFSGPQDRSGVPRHIVVAAIDGDCSAETIIAGCSSSGPTPLMVYGCADVAPARSVWNQYGYHVTSIDDDLTVPVVEATPWQAQNTWQAQSNVDLVGGPVADAGPDVQICAGNTAALDGSGSLPCDASGLEYRWLEGAIVVPGCDWSLTPTCDVAPAVTTTYTLEVSCLGLPAACTTFDTVTIIVESIPVPTADAGAGASVCEMQPVTLDASGSTDPGCPGGLVYEWRDGATVVRPADPDPTWSPPTAIAGTATYTVMVSCAGPPGCEASNDVTVEVRACALAVRFDVYRAVVQRDGGVLVTWRTLEEDGTLGFVVERVVTADGSFVAAGDHEAGGPGFRYEVRDTDVAKGAHAWYRIVELTSRGRGDATPAFRPARTDESGASRTRGAAPIGRKRQR